jgi:hypothetical protein
VVSESGKRAHFSRIGIQRLAARILRWFQPQDIAVYYNKRSQVPCFQQSASEVDIIAVIGSWLYDLNRPRPFRPYADTARCPVNPLNLTSHPKAPEFARLGDGRIDHFLVRRVNLFVRHSTPNRLRTIAAYFRRFLHVHRSQIQSASASKMIPADSNMSLRLHLKDALTICPVTAKIPEFCLSTWGGFSRGSPAILTQQHAAAHNDHRPAVSMNHKPAFGSGPKGVLCPL